MRRANGAGAAGSSRRRPSARTRTTGAQVAAIRQGMQALASAAGQQRQQEAAHQDRLQRELAAARAELAALLAQVGDVDARLKRAHNGPAGR